VITRTQEPVRYWLLALLCIVCLLLGGVLWRDDGGVEQRVLGLALPLLALGAGWLVYHRDRQLRRAYTLSSRLMRYLDLEGVGIVLIDAASREWIYANKRVAELIGVSQEQLCWEQFLRLLAPEQREQARQNMQALANGQSRTLLAEHRIQRGDNGETRILEFKVGQLEGESGQELLQASIQDVTEKREVLSQLKRQRDLYETLSQTNQLIVRAKSREQLFADICRISVEDGQMQHVWVGLLQQGELLPVAQASRDPASLQLLLDGLHQLPHDVPTFAALSQDQPVVWNWLDQTQMNAEARRLSHLAGIVSAASFPLHRDGQLIGNLTFYAREEGFFSDEVTRTLSEMANDIDFALANLERRASLKIAHQIIESSPVILMRWSPERESRILFASQNVLRWGYRAAELQGRSLLELAAAEDNARLNSVLSAISSHQQLSSSCRFRIVNGIGEQRWVEAQINFRQPDDGGEGYFEAVLRDVHRRKTSEERLSIASAVLNTTREGVLVTDSETRILEVNPGFTEALGYKPEEVIGQTPRVFSSGRHDEAFYRDMWSCIRQTGSWRGEVYNRRRDGELVPEQLSISHIADPDTGESRYVAVFADISELKRSNARLEYLAHTDPLTGLPNRAMLLSHLEQVLAAAARNDTTVALLILDLDHFKDVNDSFGHASGDLLLQRVAERLRAHLRGGDMVARIGGDEFAVVLSALENRMQAAQVAQHLIELMSEPCRLGDAVEIRPGGSVGISINQSSELLHSAEMFKQADSALYLAKSRGRGSFSFYSSELTEQARLRVELEVRLRYAIRHEQLEMYYQPQIDIGSGRIIGAEALVRWNDPVRGVIRPDQFIPLAEQSGLIVELGEWVLRAVCRQGRAWLDAGFHDLVLAANVSPPQLKESELPELLAGILAEYDFPAAALELELTEGALMHDAEASRVQLERLKGLGVGLALDDFGTGYSSLAYLKRFPIDVLKIDKSFVDGLPDSSEDSALVRSVVVMGHALGLRVLAEGVEQPVQLEHLQGLGCDCYQGYLCSRPVPAAEFAQLLLKQPSPRPAAAR